MKKLPVYEVSEFSGQQESSSFYANLLSDHLKSHQFINAPHKHNAYLCIFFMKGEGEHYIDFNTYPVQPGSVFMLNPGQVHSWKLSADTEGYVLIHSGEFYNNMFVNRKLEDFPFYYLQENYPLAILPPEHWKEFSHLFEEVYKEYYADHPLRKARLGSLTDLIYIHIVRHYEKHLEGDNGNGNNFVKMKKLQKYIDQHYKSKKLAGDYADLMNMSIRHLNRICNDTLNKTTSDLIIQRIISEAKRMLINREVSVAYVALELGYPDVSYFTRLFKKHTGKTPKEFQLSLQPE